MVNTCKSICKNGKKCNNKAKYENYCGIHKNKIEVHLETKKENIYIKKFKNKINKLLIKYFKFPIYTYSEWLINYSPKPCIVKQFIYMDVIDTIYTNQKTMEFYIGFMKDNNLVELSIDFKYQNNDENFIKGERTPNIILNCINNSCFTIINFIKDKDKHTCCNNIRKINCNYEFLNIEEFELCIQKIKNNLIKNIQYNNHPKPVLRYAGSKKQILDKIKSKIEPFNGSYYEPFAGSLSVTLMIIKEFNPRKIFINDGNKNLINFYIVLRDNLKELWNEIKNERYNNDGDSYYNLRKFYNSDKPNKIEKAASFYILNKLCFNGIYRENRKGFFNVPYGKRKNIKYNYDELENLSRVLKKMIIDNLDYKEFFEKYLKDISVGDVLYIDPPYSTLDSKAPTFNSYYSESFEENEQSELYLYLLKANRKGCKVIASNHDTTLIRKIYKDFNIEKVEVNRFINRNGNDRTKKSIEVLMTL